MLPSVSGHCSIPSACLVSNCLANGNLLIFSNARLRSVDSVGEGVAWSRM